MNKIPYTSMVNSLMYAMVYTRPNIGFATRIVNGFMSNPNKELWLAVKRVLWYLKGTSSICFKYHSSSPVLEGCMKSDMSVDVDTSRPMSRYVMTYVGDAISWQLRVQKVVALSTTKVEYMVSIEAEMEILWMRDFINELGMRQEQFWLHCDNQSINHLLTKNVSYHSITKYI